MQRCLKILEESGRSTNPEDITEEDVFLIFRTIAGVKESTVRKYLKIMDYWLEWSCGNKAVKDADILWNPDHDVRRVFISPDELKILLQNADERERLMIMLGARMGLRRCEMARLRFEDIDGEYMTIHGKGHGKDGKIYRRKMPRVVQEALHEWLRVRNSLAENLTDESDGAIIVAFGHKGYMSEISLSCISHLMRVLGEKCGIELTTHSLRRYFATNLHDHGADLEEVMILLRHEQVQTTIKCYIQPNQRRLEELAEEVSMF